MSVQVYAERLYTLPNNAFAKVDKAVVESQLPVYFIDGLDHDFPMDEGHDRKSKNISNCSTIYIGRTKFAKKKK